MSNLNKKLLLGITIIIIGIVFIVLSKDKKSDEMKHVTIGIQTSPAMALVMVAKDKGFFEKQGLDVELKQFAAGKDALAAFIGGSLDFSISGDVPALLATLQGNRFVVPAQVVKKTINEVRVVAQKDGDLNTADSYFKAKKRKLATSIGGGPEFFTYEFLNKIGVTKDQIEIVAQKPADMPAALVSKSVDAVAIFDPVAYVAETQLGDKSITFTDPSIYSELYIIEAKESVKQDSVVLSKVLKALIEAEKFTKQNPEDAKAIVINYTKLSKETVDNIWGSFDFSVALTPQLLDYWNRETKWAQDTAKVTKDAVIPNFRDMIFDAPLKKISPTAVEI